MDAKSRQNSHFCTIRSMTSYLGCFKGFLRSVKRGMQVSVRSLLVNGYMGTWVPWYMGTMVGKWVYMWVHGYISKRVFKSIYSV